MKKKTKKLRGESGRRRRSIYIPDDLYEDITVISYENDMSINAQMVEGLREWVGMYKGKK